MNYHIYRALKSPKFMFFASCKSFIDNCSSCDSSLVYVQLEPLGSSLLLFPFADASGKNQGRASTFSPKIASVKLH